MNIPDIKECIKGQVTFSHYRSGQLWYTCDNGFTFPVPVDDTGDAKFEATDKGMFFMRYIRKHMKDLEKDSNGENTNGG